MSCNGGVGLVWGCLACLQVYCLTSFIEANNLAEVKVLEMWGASSGGEFRGRGGAGRAAHITWSCGCRSCATHTHHRTIDDCHVIPHSFIAQYILCLCSLLLSAALWCCPGMSTPAEMEIVLQESRDSVREAKIQLVMLDQSMVTR